MDIEYGLRGVQRSEFEVDNYQLQNFHALESDWHEISHWVMSIEDNLSSINNTLIPQHYSLTLFISA